MAAPENGSIYFDRNDLYSVDPTMSSRQIVQRSFSDLLIYTFDMSRDGRTIVYEEGCGFCSKDISGPLYTIRRDSHADGFSGRARAKVDITNLWDCSSVPATTDFDCTYDQVKTMPRFSPDGETIYFVGQYLLGPEEKTRGLYSVPTEGGEATRIPIRNPDGSPRSVGFFALSHDGSTFAINGGPGVYTVPVSGGPSRRVNRDPCGGSVNLSFSPDDKTIVYDRITYKDDNCSTRTGTTIRTLYTTPVDNDGTQPGTPLFPEDVANPDTHGNKYYPTFSPDGKYVAFSHERKDGFDSVAFTPATGGSIDNIASTFCTFCHPLWFERLPDTTIDSGPSGTVGSTSAEFGFSSDQGDATFQCKLDGGTFEACASPKSVPDEGALAEGTHTFEVRAVDTAGGADPTPASRTWTVDDTTAPIAPVITSPAVNSFDTDGTITLSGTAESNSTVEVFEATASGDISKGTTPIDASGAWTKTLSSVSDGSHTYTAKATDASGNTSSASNSVTVTVDTSSPETNIASGPSGPTNDNTPTFSFSGSDNLSQAANLRYSYNVDGSAWSAYSSETSVTLGGASGLSEGPHTFYVKAKDEAGNEDVSPTQRSFMVDTTAPTAKAPTHKFTTLSTLATSTVPVKLTWSATDNPDGSGIASYQLQQSINGGAYTDVTLPSATATTISASLAPGTTYSYRVAAKDNAGNLSAWATGPSFKVTAFQESSSAIVDTGSWTTSALSGAYGGSVQYASALGRNATFTVPSGSKNVEWVSYRGNRGKAQVWLDGVQQDAKPSVTGIQPFDLYSSSVQARKVVFSKAVSPTTSHKLEVRVLGQKNASSTSTRVDIDAFVTTS